MDIRPIRLRCFGYVNLYALKSNCDCLYPNWTAFKTVPADLNVSGTVLLPSLNTSSVGHHDTALVASGIQASLLLRLADYFEKLFCFACFYNDFYMGRVG